MDILLHTFSGVAIASVVANVAPISAGKRAKLFFFGALGGALPDVDAISLWSKFDETIGAFLHLEHSGRDIYFNTFPYSHHGAMHSLLFPLLLILSAQLIRFGIQKLRKGEKNSFINRLKARKWSIITFFMAYLLHIVEDMPTPGAAWEGVNLLWPADIWVGGSGDIWWWNNYDLFLIVNSIIVINVLVLIIPALTKALKKRIALGVFSFGLLLGIYQIKTRGFDFDYQGFAPDYKTSEAKSKEIQREILGDKVYGWMEKLDQNIPLNF